MKTKSIDELEKLVISKKAEMDKVALRIGSEKEKNVKKIKNLKLEIAKIMTLITEKNILQKEETQK